MHNGFYNVFVLFLSVCLGFLRICLLWVFLSAGRCVWLSMFPVRVFLFLPGGHTPYTLGLGICFCNFLLF